MRHHFSIVVALVSLATTALAHEDSIAPLSRVEKDYNAPPPIGTIRVAYRAAAGDRPASLGVACDAMRCDVPAAGLVDLPRPDFGGLVAAYSTTSFENGRWTDRPYVYVSVPLHGPPGGSWTQTWATFHVDADGRLTRRIKRFVPGANAVDVIWKEWPIGGGTSATDVLQPTTRP
jgi:hypothetical protein